MLELRPGCECCDVDLPPESVAFICTFECTWCEACAARMAHECPNCGGELVRRPIRPAHLLVASPPSSTRILAPGCVDRLALEVVS